MTKPLVASRVLVTARSFGSHEPSLRAELEAAVGEVRYNQTGRSLTAGELRQQLGGVDGLLAGLDEIDATVLAMAPCLRVIARYGVGISNVDLLAAREYGVVVTNTPGANTEAVAELAIGFLFALARSVLQADRAVQAEEWPTISGIEVAGRTLGLLGFGKIGQSVARRASALGCVVVAYDPYVDDATAAVQGARLISLDEVVSIADFLSLHLPLTPETRGFVDHRLLRRMRRGAYVINTARGELVVEEDLMNALDDGQVSGAALDTLTDEPPRPDHPLLHRSNVLITPHMGAHTRESTTTMGRWALDDLLAVLAGREPRFPVVSARELKHVR